MIVLLLDSSFDINITHAFCCVCGSKSFADYLHFAVFPLQERSLTNAPGTAAPGSLLARMSSLAISVSTRASSRSGAQTATAVFLDLTTCPYTAGAMTPCEYPRPQQTCCTGLLSVCWGRDCVCLFWLQLAPVIGVRTAYWARLMRLEKQLAGLHVALHILLSPLHCPDFSFVNLFLGWILVRRPWLPSLIPHAML